MSSMRQIVFKSSFEIMIGKSQRIHEITKITKIKRYLKDLHSEIIK